MAFFGFRLRQSESVGQEASCHKRKISAELKAPDSEGIGFMDADGVGGELPDESLPGDLFEDAQEAEADYRRHGKEITANPKRGDPATGKEEEWWDCPICSRPQAANERLFNEHIDLCLSRQTIRDAVQQDVGAQPLKDNIPEAKRARFGEKKRGRLGATIDPKQKLLFFP
jgi:DNA polymerase kappa